MIAVFSDFFSKERGCVPFFFSRSKSRGRPTNGRDRQRGESRGKRLREIDERVVKLAPVDRKPAVELVEDGGEAFRPVPGREGNAEGRTGRRTGG